MEPIGSALVWWLVLTQTIIPVPYSLETSCVEAGEKMGGIHNISFVCVSQPAEDIVKFGNQFSGPQRPNEDYE